MLAGVGLGTGLKGLGCVSRSLVVDVKRLHGLGVDVRNVVWDVTLEATVSVSTGLGANSSVSVSDSVSAVWCRSNITASDRRGLAARWRR